MTVRLRLVNIYLDSLYQASSYSTSIMVWMPVNSGIAVNCKADELARTGTSITLTAEWERLGSPCASCSSLLDCQTLDQLSKHYFGQLIATVQVLL